jgi:hypothetical protein
MEKLVKSFNEFVNENILYSDYMDMDDDYESDYDFDSDMEQQAQEIIDNYEPYGIIHIGDSEEGYSVLIGDRNSSFETWVDVAIDRNDVATDWNAYIFTTNNSIDVIKNKVQSNTDVFDYATSEAVYHLEKLGLLVNGQGGWSYGNGTPRTKPQSKTIPMMGSGGRGVRVDEKKKTTSKKK